MIRCEVKKCSFPHFPQVRLLDTVGGPTPWLTTKKKPFTLYPETDNIDADGYMQVDLLVNHGMMNPFPLPAVLISTSVGTFWLYEHGLHTA